MMKIKGITVPAEERYKSDFRDPAKYYIVNAVGDAVYYSTRSRQKAQELADEDWGKGKYTIRVAMTAQIR